MSVQRVDGSNLRSRRGWLVADHPARPQVLWLWRQNQRPDLRQLRPPVIWLLIAYTAGYAAVLGFANLLFNKSRLGGFWLVYSRILARLLHPRWCPQAA